MFPYPRSKSQLTRPESSEMYCQLPSGWLYFCEVGLNSTAAETLDVVKMCFFLEDDDVPPQQEPVGQARCISQHQQQMGFTDLNLAWVQDRSNTKHSVERFANAASKPKQTRFLHSIIKGPFLSHKCSSEQRQYIAKNIEE